MNTNTEHGLVIVGAGLAGVNAAEGARTAGWTGSITMIGAEPYVPYEKPPLSKAILLGDAGPRTAFVHADGWEVTHNVELLLGAPTTAIDREAKTVTLDGGRTVAYDQLILAMGAAARTPDFPGADLDGLFTLRTLDESLAIRDRLVPGAKVAVVGGNWISTEVAAAAKLRGAEVTLIGSEPLLLSKGVGEDIAKFYTDLHRSHGIDLKLDAKVTAINSGGGDDAQVESLTLDDGTTVVADVVVLGLGAVPQTQLAEAAGLAVDNGVEVDEHLLTTDPNIYAVGDIAAVMNPTVGKRLRVEHWDVARGEGQVAGANAAAALLGRSDQQVYDDIPYFYSDQYDTGMEYAGLRTPYDEFVVRGSLDDGEFVGFELKDNVVVGGINVNVWDVNDEIQALIKSRKPVDKDVLTDPAVAPADWLAKATA